MSLFWIGSIATSSCILTAHLVGRIMRHRPQRRHRLDLRDARFQHAEDTEPLGSGHRDW